MNHLKLYEDFFSFFRYDQLSDKDTEKVFGLTREDIELRLLDITDEIDGLHVSVNFDIDGAFLDSKEIFILTDSKTGQLYYEYVLPEGVSGEISKRYPIKNFKIQIHFYLSGELMNSIKDDKKRWVVGKRGKGSEYNVSDISNGIKDLFEKNKIREYFEQHGWLVHILKNDSVDLIHNNINGLLVGRTAFSIFLGKKLL